MLGESSLLGFRQWRIDKKRFLREMSIEGVMEF